MTNKEKYRELCKTESSIPIFSRDWWMDAVCGEDGWDVLMAESDNRVTAALPFYLKKRFGFRLVYQPPFTQTNGVWIKYPSDQTPVHRISHEMRNMDEIIQQMDSLKLHYFEQCFHYSIINWLPFYWKYFRQTTRYTYVLEDLTDMERIYRGFNDSIRRNIKKAQKLVTVKEDCDIETFYELNKKTYTRQGMKVPYSVEFLKRFDTACLEHNCRKILYAEDKEGNIHSAIYMVWDENSVYVLLNGGDPVLRKSQAQVLLTWNAIQLAGRITRKFDFEGSMIEPIERFNRSFGAVLKPYFCISKGYGVFGKLFGLAKNTFSSHPGIKRILIRLRG